MSLYTWAWLFWIAMFFVVEGPAVLNKTPGDTLTEHVRKWFAVKDKPPGWRLRRIALLSFLAWLCVHFLTGWV